jgi:DnaJ family protein A protein 2
VFKDRKVLEVNIEKGMTHGQKIRFSGEADEIPGTIPGDVIIVVQEKEHETFKRKGADLVIEMEIQLSEALCGFVRTITHLDNRVIKIESPPGSVVKHDSLKLVKGEGMPQHGNIFNKGGLFIHFSVKFPKSTPINVLNAIKAVMPLPPPPTLTGDEEEHDMNDVDVSQIGKGADGGRSMMDGENDDDDDGHSGGAQRVQCGQS